MAHRVKGEQGSGASQTIPSQFQFIHCVNCSMNDTIFLTKAFCQSKHIEHNIYSLYLTMHLSKVEYKAMKNNVVREREGCTCYIHEFFSDLH